MATSGTLGRGQALTAAEADRLNPVQVEARKIHVGKVLMQLNALKKISAPMKGRIDALKAELDGYGKHAPAAPAPATGGK